MIYIRNSALPLEGEEQEVLKDIANTFGVCPYLIISDCRAMAVVRPRWIFWTYLYNHGYNAKECGGKTDGRDHSTVLTGFKKMQNELMFNETFCKAYTCLAEKYNLKQYDSIKSWNKYRRDKITGTYYQSCA